METVSVTELKARLSQYLAIVRRGGEVQVLDRGIPVARLIGPASTALDDTDEAAWVARLTKSGLVRSGRGDVSWLLDEHPLPGTGQGTGAAPDAGLSAALADDREDRL